VQHFKDTLEHLSRNCVGRRDVASMLTGYREARGEWLLQTDGDGELPPSKFGVLWNHREEFDFLGGCVNGGALLHESSNRISQSQR
jgi:hypothetical protein